MHSSFIQLVALLPLLAAAIPTSPTPNVIPLSKRVKLTNEDGVVNPDALRLQLVKVTNKVQRGLSAFEKNTGSPHPNDSKRLKAKRATGAVPLAQAQDGSLWQGSVSVGTPASIFTVVFDTGSSDFFLPGANCGDTCEGHKHYNTASSSTAQDQGRNFRLEFGDGSTVEGEVFTDTVTLGDLTVTNQAIGSSSRYSTELSLNQFPPDGLMGMAFEEISVFKNDPFFQTAIAQGRVTDGVFSVKLATSGSELYLGGVNTKLYTGDFTQVPVTKVGFWQVNLDAVSVNGRAAVSDLEAMIDTGSTVIKGDSASVKKFYAAVPGSEDASNTVGAGYFTFPCNNVPTVSLTFGGKAFTVSVDTFNLGQVSEGSTQCVGGIVGAGDDGKDDGFWIVGDVFLQNVYTSFDMTNRRVGFADLA